MNNPNLLGQKAAVTPVGSGDWLGGVMVGQNDGAALLGGVEQGEVRYALDGPLFDERIDRLMRPIEWLLDKGSDLSGRLGCRKLAKMFQNLRFNFFKWCLNRFCHKWKNADEPPNEKS